MFHRAEQDRTVQGGMRTEWREDRLLSRLKSLTTVSAATHLKQLSWTPEFWHVLYVQLISVLLFSIFFHLKILSSSL